MNFDFDAWTRLAKEDPQEFERQRRIALQVAVEGASPQHRERLEAMQSLIDFERDRTGTALDSCVRMNSLMWAGFFRLRKELGKLGAGADRSAAKLPKPAPGTTARVIPLRPPAHESRVMQKSE
jgi:hypothetical protein